MLSLNELLNRLHSMSPSEVTDMVRKALDMSGIPYTTHKGGISLETLLPSRHRMIPEKKIEFAKSESRHNIQYDKPVYVNESLSVDIVKKDSLYFQIEESDKSSLFLTAA